MSRETGLFFCRVKGDSPSIQEKRMLGLDDDNSESYKNIAIGSLRAADAIIERLKKE